MGLMKYLAIVFENKKESCSKCLYGKHDNLDICYKCVKKESQFKPKRD